MSDLERLARLIQQTSDADPALEQRYARALTRQGRHEDAATFLVERGQHEAAARLWLSTA